MGAAGEQGTQGAGRVCGGSLYPRVVRPTQTVAVMLESVQLRALLHQEEQQRQQNGDDGVVAGHEERIRANGPTDCSPAFRATSSASWPKPSRRAAGGS